MMGPAIWAVPPTIDDLLAQARFGLRRVEPMSAFRAVRGGAVLIDIRPEWQRRADGEIPAAMVIERNHLEWRCDPACPGRVPEATGHDVSWIVCCDEGYSSSLAAASLQALGLHKGHRPDRRLPGLARRRAAGGRPRTAKTAAATTDVR